MRPGVPIVCEIDNGANVSFLCGEETMIDEEQTVDRSFTNTGPFAAGAVYVDSLQDKLSVQAFYNPNLVRIIRELVVGQAEEGEYEEPNVAPSHLTFTKVPRNFHGKSFIQLFQHLMVKDMALPLGLYRSAPWGHHASGSQMPYVITNPPADLLMQSDDFVYTLDSKLVGDTILEISVLRGRNFSILSRPGVEARACKVQTHSKVQTQAASFVTPAVSGAAPVWDCGPFCICLREDSWPVQISLSVLGQGAKLHQGKELMQAVGQLVLSDRSELGEGQSEKFWVQLDPHQTADDEEFLEREEVTAEAPAARRAEINVMITYSKPATSDAAYGAVNMVQRNASSSPTESPVPRRSNVSAEHSAKVSSVNAKIDNNSAVEGRPAAKAQEMTSGAMTDAARIVSQRLDNQVTERELEKEQEREQVQRLVLDELYRSRPGSAFSSSSQAPDAIGAFLLPSMSHHQVEYVLFLDAICASASKLRH